MSLTRYYEKEQSTWFYLYLIPVNFPLNTSNYVIGDWFSPIKSLYLHAPPLLQFCSVIKSVLKTVREHVSLYKLQVQLKGGQFQTTQLFASKYSLGL